MTLRASLEITRGGSDVPAGPDDRAFRLAMELTVAPGEVLALLGPNGAGKSTVLRALAGLLPLSAGRVELDGETVEDVAASIRQPVHDRRIGVVFQDYLLFPHLTVVDNVAFGPRSRGMSKSDARTYAGALLERVGLGAYVGAKPRQLSGGQAQRVALARALATEPRLLLLDEPLAALDARTRLHVRGELRRQLTSYDGMAIVVSHDPLDALVLADRLVVLEHGSVVQAGTPSDVARRPRTDYVARLVGLNLLRGRLDDGCVRTDSGFQLVAHGSDRSEFSTGARVYACFRPAAVALYRDRPAGSPRNVWQAAVAGLEPLVDGVRVELAPDRASAVAASPDTDDVPADPSIMADITAVAVADLDLAPGARVWLSVKAAEIDVYPEA